MSSLPPDPYQQPTQAGRPEILDSGYGSSVPARRPRTGARKGIAIGAALVVVAGLTVGGYVAWSAFFATGPQPAEALPDSTVGYLSIDLDPAGRQKLEARETLGKFPALDGRIDTDSEGELRQSLFDRFQEAGACPELDWGDDVDPWLGDRFAVAAVDLGKQDDDTEFGVTPVLVAQVKDADRAGDGLGALLDCAGAEMGEEQFGWSIAGEWAVLAETDELAEAVTDAAADAPLSDDDDFQRWTGAAGDHGVLTAYASPEAGDLLAEGVATMDGTDDDGQQVLRQYFEEFDGASLQVRFADGGIELEAASSVDLLAAAGYGVLAESDGGDDVVASLPDDTAAALGVGFEPGWVEALIESYASLTGDQVDIDELLGMAEDELGLDLPDDVEALLGESAALAVGPDIDPDAEDPSDIDVALKIKGDPDEVADVLDKLADNPEVAEDLGEVLDYDVEDNHVVVGPNSGYREDLLDRGNLGQSDKYEDVVPESGRAGTVFYLDVDAFDDLIEAEAGDDELVENLQVLAAVGYSTWTDDDVAHALVKVTTDD